MTLSIAQADERRQQVLDRVDAHRVAHQAGGVVDAADVLDGGRHLEATEVGAPETDAGVSGRRLERERDLVARMQTDPRAGGGSPQCPLCVHQALWAVPGDEAPMSKPECQERPSAAISRA